MLALGGDKVLSELFLFAVHLQPSFYFAFERFDQPRNRNQHRDALAPDCFEQIARD